MLYKLLLLSVAFLSIGYSAGAQVAPVTDDLFDVSTGMRIITASSVKSSSDIRDMFGGEFGNNARGSTVFDNMTEAGTVHAVEWVTATPVHLTSVNLLTTPDRVSPDPTTAKHGYSQFRLYARELNGQYVQVASYTPSDPLQPTAVSIDTDDVTSTRFKAEFVQAQATYAPRIIELDGIGEVLPAQEEYAPSSDDLWDIAQGTVVTSHSSIRTLNSSNETSMFGYGDEPGDDSKKRDTVFMAGEAGSIHYIEWQTEKPVRLEHIRIFAYHDQFRLANSNGPFRDAKYHGFQKVTLWGKNAAGVFEQFYEYYPTNPYDNVLAPGTFLVAADVPSIVAQEFRAEFTQWPELPPDFPQEAGPRIEELDGFGEVMEEPERTPVLIVPGILGTELLSGEDTAWIDLQRMLTDINDDFLVDYLRLDEEGESIGEVSVGDVIQEAGLPSSTFFNNDIFVTLIATLESIEYVLGVNFDLFPYDWRLSLDSPLQDLHENIERMKTQSGASKVNIVAHSMGGLLVKNYIQQYGEDDIEKIVFVGTPHLGSPKSAKVLLEGDRFSIPWLEADAMKTLSLNSASAYQLLPNSTYFNEFTGYIRPYSFFGTQQPLDIVETKNFLLGKDINSGLFAQAEAFWNKDLQNLTFNNTEVYNIAGCGLSTQAGYSYAIGNSVIGAVKYTSGDTTVPLVSASYINTPDAHKYYVRKGDHTLLPSQERVHDLIAQLLGGGELTSYDDISNDSTFCNFRGKELVWRSPVDVHIYDNAGNHTGPVENNAIEYGIPGVEYDIIGHRKFMLLPTDNGETYTVKANGTDTGTFDVVISENDNGELQSSSVFNDVPVTTATLIEVGVTGDVPVDSILVDTNGSGAMEEVPAYATLGAGQGEDVAAPVTTASLEGTQGQNGWHTGTVKVKLEPQDDLSGVHSTYYSLDNGQSFTTYQDDIVIDSEGMHTIQFYSVDNAGNNEEVQNLELKTDTTAPELVMYFNESTGDVVFEGADAADTSPVVTCTKKECEITDEAGHVTQVTFKRKVERDWRTVLQLSAVAYDGVKTDISRNVFRVNEHRGTKVLSQVLHADSRERVRIDYIPRKDVSLIINKEKGERPVREIRSGKTILQLKTQQGEVEWSLK